MAGRLCGRTFVAFVLVWLLALVGWPERHVLLTVNGNPARWSALAEPNPYRLRFVLTEPASGSRSAARVLEYGRDASLRVLADALFPPSPPNWSRQTFGAQ